MVRFCTMPVLTTLLRLVLTQKRPVGSRLAHSTVCTASGIVFCWLVDAKIATHRAVLPAPDRPAGMSKPASAVPDTCAYADKLVHPIQ